jgi:hypothetical protein
VVASLLFPPAIRRLSDQAPAGRGITIGNKV